MFDHSPAFQLREEVSALRRPRLLIRAARCGQDLYSRPRDLKRLLDTRLSVQPTAALQALVSLESRFEEARLAEAPSYSFALHVEVLIALMAEARALFSPALTAI